MAQLFGRRRFLGAAALGVPVLAWTTTDRMRASKPVVLTAQLRGDQAITRLAERRFVIAGRPSALKVNVRTPAVQSVIAPGVVVAAGPPGHVDRGPTQERGTVLRLSLPASKDATLVTGMRF